MNASESGSFAAFSVDVEDYYQAEALRPFCPRSKWDSFQDRVEANTDRILELLHSQSTSGTFFILGCVAEKHTDLVRRIAAAGHEVASHGFAHELIYRQDPDTFRQDVRRARGLLQDLSGQEVVGYRAPSYTIVQKTQWALRVLVEEGHRYDSSIFPIPRRRYGMPKARRVPHRIDVEGASIVEFPLPTVRFGPVNLPATGGAYLRLLPFGFQKAAVRGMLDRGIPFVLSIHPWEIDPDQPSFPVGLRTRWTHYHNLSRAEGRLRSLLSLTHFRPLSEVLTSLGLIEAKHRKSDVGLRDTGPTRRRSDSLA